MGIRTDLDILVNIKNKLKCLLEFKEEVEKGYRDVNYLLLHLFIETSQDIDSMFDDVIKYYQSNRTDILFYKLIKSTLSAINFKAMELFHQKKLRDVYVIEMFSLTEDLIDNILPELDIRIEFLIDNPDKVIEVYPNEDIDEEKSELDGLYNFQTTLDNLISFYQDTRYKDFKYNGYSLISFYEYAQSLYDCLYTNGLSSLLEEDEFSILSLYVIGVFTAAETLMEFKQVKRNTFYSTIEVVSGSFRENSDFISKYVNRLIRKYKNKLEE